MNSGNTKEYKNFCHPPARIFRVSEKRMRISGAFPVQFSLVLPYDDIVVIEVQKKALFTIVRLINKRRRTQGGYVCLIEINKVDRWKLNKLRVLFICFMIHQNMSNCFAIAKGISQRSSIP